MTVQQVPIHLCEATHKVINKALADGIIKKVEELTEWISPGFFMPKEGGRAGL